MSQDEYTVNAKMARNDVVMAMQESTGARLLLPVANRRCSETVLSAGRQVQDENRQVIYRQTKGQIISF